MAKKDNHFLLDTSVSIQNEEINVATFFIEWLNLHRGLQYSVPQKPTKNGNLDEHTDVDVFSEPISANYSKIYMQIVTAEPRLGSKQAECFWNPSNFIPYNTQHKSDIQKMLYKKERKYSTNQKKGLTLLLYRQFGPLLDEKYAHEIFDHDLKSDFKNIFYIHLPSRFSSHPHSGQVIQLK